MPAEIALVDRDPVERFGATAGLPATSRVTVTRPVAGAGDEVSEW
jgi:hypothetical protein